jgi:gas vesicle protein
MTLGKVLLGVVVGAVIGAAAGVLFAPKKGSVTRKFIAKKSKKYAGEMEGKFNGLIDSINEKIETVKDEATRITKIAKQKADKMDAEVSSFTNK